MNQYLLISRWLVVFIGFFYTQSCLALTETELNRYLNASAKYYRLPSQKFFDDSYGANNNVKSLNPQLLTPEKLMQRIQALPEQSIEATLRTLRYSHPHMFINYVLMYRSRSLQDASFLFPRALLVDRDARFVVTHNGHSGQKGYDRLEIMHFDANQLRFNFHEIIFAENKATLSVPNPLKCMRCHQSSQRENIDPRPNWEPYNVWPGAYQSIKNRSQVVLPESPRYIPELHDLKAEEFSRYKEFVTLQIHHDRYRYLRPQRRPLLVEKLDQQTHYYPERFYKGLWSTPITHFTAATLALNYLRVARMIQDSPLFPYYRETLIAGLTCQSIFMPEPLYQWHQNNYLRKKENIYQTRSWEPTDYYNGKYVDSFPTLFSFLFEPHGVQTDDWSTDFGTGGTLAHSSRFGSPGVAFQQIVTAMKAVWDNPEDFDKPCEELAKTSYTKLSQFWHALAPHLPTQHHPSPDKLMNRCLQCHGVDNYIYGAPNIPFIENPELNAADLHKTGYPRGTLYDEILYRIGPDALFKERMPADGYIPSSAEMNVFRDYLEELFHRPTP